MACGACGHGDSVETPKIRMILLVVDSNHGHEHAACAAKMGHLLSLSRYLDPYPVHVNWYMYC